LQYVVVYFTAVIALYCTHYFALHCIVLHCLALRGFCVLQVLEEAQEMAVRDHNVEFKSNLWICKSVRECVCVCVCV